MAADSSSRKSTHNDLALLSWLVNDKADDQGLAKALSVRFPEFVRALQIARAPAYQEWPYRWLVDERAIAAVRAVLRRCWIESQQHGPCHDVMDWLSLYWLAWRAALGHWDKAPADDGIATVADFCRRIHRVLMIVEQSKDRLRFCANRDCQMTPYFLKTSRRQDYCSLQCAAEGTKEAKRKWWARQGKKQRAAKLHRKGGK
jgi:hypothetical protein